MEQKTPSLKLSSIVPYLILIIVVIISIFPFIWTGMASTHTSSQVFQAKWSLRPGTNFITNYRNLCNFSNIWVNLFNSIFIALAYTALVCVVDAMAGYAFVKFRFKGRDAIFFICLCSMFIPQQVTMIPLFIELNAFNLIDTPWAVILPMATTIFGVFLMRQSLADFPDELLEAARIDGTGEFRLFAQIVVPTMKPAFASLGILSFVQRWGDYMWPLIVLQSKENQTLPLILALMTTPGNPIDYGAALLGAVIVTIPVLIMFLCFQKNFINAIMSGAVKG
jgi:lactose/L-arabinose transport system permease protein